MIILGVETSCDETAAACIKDGRQILSNIVASQDEIHKKYGGIVPELASRRHIELILPVIKESLEEVNLSFRDIEYIIVTQGPGLVGSLLIGLSTVKAISYALNIPFCGVNHIEGHIHAIFLCEEYPEFPFLALVVSGGHTSLFLVKDHGKYNLIARSRDDAAGEAFDKVAKVLGLGYPGGPIIEKYSRGIDDNRVVFPRAQMSDGSLDFSFSGIKTAVFNHVKKRYLQMGILTPEYSGALNDPFFDSQSPLDKSEIASIAAAFQKAVIEDLVSKTLLVAKRLKVERIVITGGVAANGALRAKFKHETQENEMRVFMPPPNLCTDNAAMIACAGYYRILRGEKSDYKLNAVANLKLG